MEFRFDDPLWITSQVLAFVALILSFWAWQIKEKIRLMIMVGTFSMFLAASAACLENYTLGVLFGLAGIRNYVFSYLDWRISKEKFVYKWLPIFFACVFVILTVGSTVVLVYVFQVPTRGAWLEWLICATLIGLIIGNIQTGTNLMRVSFIANRVFNIINHVFFNNIVAVIIAATAIGSNIIFYIRQLISWYKDKNKEEEIAS